MPPKEEPKTTNVILGRPKNNLRIGLVGLPNVGKSTTFNILGNANVPAENYPFCTIDPHEARASVKDTRFDWLCDHFKPARSIPAVLTIFDIAGLVPGASKGEGLGNAFLSHIESVDGLFHVIRAFEEDEVIHVLGEVNPVKDAQAIHKELILKDLSKAKNMLADVKKVALRSAKDLHKRLEMEVLEKSVEMLENDKWIAGGSWKINEVDVLNTFNFLTAKPVVYLINLSENDFLRKKNKWLAPIHRWITETNPGPIVPFSASYESKLIDEVANITEPSLIEEKLKTSQLNKIIHTGYTALHLMHFFTCGHDEVRCWTIRKGTKAPQAAGVIHTDFQRGFICAEVYKYDDIVEYGNEANVKANGRYLKKGKDYVVEDGDIIFFKFNVTTAKKQ